MLYKAHELTRWLKEKKRKDRHALLGGADDEKTAEGAAEGAAAAEEAAASGNATGGERRTLLYWKPTLRVQLVHMHMPFARNGVPPQIAQHMSFDPSGDYYPIVYARARFFSRALIIFIRDRPGSRERESRARCPQVRERVLAHAREARRGERDGRVVRGQQASSASRRQ